MLVREAATSHTKPLLIKKLTAKTVDEDPAGCQRWISTKEI